MAVESVIVVQSSSSSKFMTAVGTPDDVPVEADAVL